MEKFSVLMSLYAKEKPQYFDESIKSVLSNSVIPDEIVIVLDGPITDELSRVLDKYVTFITSSPLRLTKGWGWL